MNNESVREHFVEEVTDTFMYLFDMMESYGITADEFTRAYVKKYEHNMGRSWHENDAMYEKCKWKLVIFDLTDGLPVTPRLLEVLSKTELKLAAVTSDAAFGNAFLRNELEADMFDLTGECGPRKELISDIAAHFGIAPDTVVVCTDSDEGVRAAEENGMTVYRVGEGVTLDGLQDFLGFPQ